MSWTSTKHGIMCLGQGHSAVTPIRLEPAIPRSRVKHSTDQLAPALTKTYLLNHMESFYRLLHTYECQHCLTTGMLHMAGHCQLVKYTRQKKKRTTKNCSTPRKITRDRPV